MDISSILTDLHITPNYSGYKYIREAIRMAVEQDIDLGISKFIYPEIAKQMKTTPSAVEKNISNAIRSNWHKSGVEVRVRFFGESYLHQTKAPTNREFIMTIADRLRFRYPQLNKNRENF